MNRGGGEQQESDRAGFLRDVARARRDRDAKLAKLLSGVGGKKGAPLEERVYGELKKVAEACVRDQGPHATLQPTMVVHEAYCKLFDRTELNVNDRQHFFALAAKAMRQVIVERARHRGRKKRGGDLCAVTLHDAAASEASLAVDPVDLASALAELTARDARQGKVVELKFFGGLEMDEIAGVLGTSKRTVEREWQAARDWLVDRLGGGA